MFTLTISMWWRAVQVHPYHRVHLEVHQPRRHHLPALAARFRHQAVQAHRARLRLRAHHQLHFRLALAPHHRRPLVTLVVVSGPPVSRWTALPTAWSMGSKATPAAVLCHPRFTAATMPGEPPV